MEEKRRKSDREGGDRENDDHDLLIAIHGDVKHLVETVAEHIENDKEAFEKQDKMNEFSKKMFYGGLGIWFVITILLKLLK